MEGRNLDLPPNDKISNRVWSGRSTGRCGGVRVLHCHVGDGRPFADYVYRGTVDGGRTSRGIRRGNLGRCQALTNNQGWNSG